MQKESIATRKARHTAFLNQEFITLAALSWESFLQFGRGIVRVTFNPQTGGSSAQYHPPDSLGESAERMAKEYDPKTQFVLVISDPDGPQSDYRLGTPNMTPPMAYKLVNETKDEEPTIQVDPATIQERLPEVRGETIEAKRTRHAAFLSSEFTTLAAYSWASYLRFGRGTVVVTFNANMEGYKTQYFGPESKGKNAQGFAMKYDPKTQFVLVIREPDGQQSDYHPGLAQMTPPMAYELVNKKAGEVAHQA